VVLEMDSARLPSRVKDALKSLKERLKKRIDYGGIEHQAIVGAGRSLGALKSARRKHVENENSALQVVEALTIPMTQPFRAFAYILCVLVFFLQGFASVPLMTDWIR
jgi:hypothetical protein